MVNIKYVLVFLKHHDKLLLINRNNPPWMGCWNGIGGKIENDETADQASIRETSEETGYQITDLKLLARVYWIINADHQTLGGMDCFLGELDHQSPDELVISDEGILAWKPIDWILDPLNSGIAKNLRFILPNILNNNFQTYLCTYRDHFDHFESIKIINQEEI